MDTFETYHPPEGKDLHPACLFLYCLYNWGCYNGAQMGFGYGRKRDGLCQPMHGIYARSGVYTRLEREMPLVALYM
jgi:hypothetical protein